jgi:uncharacterized protein (TIGR02284 family)
MNTNTSKETIGILQDLVKINNDRIEGYIKAIEETPAEQNNLLSLFRQMIEQSEGYVQELQSVINSRGGDQVEHSTTGMGKVYRLWMDIRASLLGHKPKTVLDLCEFGEDAALKAYKEALESDETFGTDVRTVILRQEAELLDSHDIIKSHRDQLHAIDR